MIHKTTNCKTLPVIKYWNIRGFAILLALILQSCGSNNNLNFIKLNINNRDEILLDHQLINTITDLENSFSELTSKENPIHLLLDISDSTSYSRFYKVRELIQSDNQNILVSLDPDQPESKYYKISSKPNFEILEESSKEPLIRLESISNEEILINGIDTTSYSEVDQQLRKIIEGLKRVDKAQQSSMMKTKIWLNLGKETSYAAYKQMGIDINRVIKDFPSTKIEIIELSNKL